MTIAVQTAVGGIGSKATTDLSYSFSTLVNTGTFQYGFNKNGIYLVNTGEQDDGVDYERSFILASTDLGISNLKRVRFLFFGADVDDAFTVSVMGDDKVWRDYDVDLIKTGLQEIRLVVGKDGEGRYWKIKITSVKRFRIDSIMGKFFVRSLGVRG